MSRRSLVLGALALLAAGPVFGADAPAAARKEPIFRLEAGGPTSVVTSLAYSPDGTTLYVAGYDKVVRTWRRQADGTFRLQDLAYRVPIGPGYDGAINALAVSSDGQWLAVAGQMLLRARAQQARGRPGLVHSIAGLSDDNWLDMGTVYVFDTRTGAVRPFRGHRGTVVALAFAPTRKGQPPLLVSAARERDTNADRYFGLVQLWDVDTGKVQDTWRALDRDPGLARPGLAVGRPGGQPDELRVGLAWKDGLFRVRDPGRHDDWKVEDGTFDGTAAYLPDQDSFLTTSFRRGARGSNPGGHLQEWDAAPGRAPAARRQLAFPTESGTIQLPQALALCSSQAGGPPDVAALVVRLETRGQPFKHVLRLIDLRGRFRASEDVDLGWEESDLPVLAAAAGGTVAVAGNAGDHRVTVYAVRDLLARVAKPQVLRSEGTTIRYAAFVKNAAKKATGLLLYRERPETAGRPPRDPWTGGLVYDFAARTLTEPAGEDHGGWQLDEPDAGGWARPATRPVGQGANQRPAIVLQRQGAEQGRVELRPGAEVDVAVVLPPRAPLDVPIVAVAWRDRQQLVHLTLYNGATGEEVRQLAGHTGLIRSLAFAGDGRLLVSTAEDQTVCLWSLTDLGRLVGMHGALPGLGVKYDAARKVLLISGVDPGPVADAGVVPGEVVESLAPEGGRAQGFASSLEFAEALWPLKPKTKVTLVVRNAQGQARPVVLAVGQGVDERKPLLFLFVTRAGRVEDREWIGWNPAGPYDSSARRTERLIGWHFNPAALGLPGAAAGTFASADQYRKEYRRQGIVKDLVVAGNLSDALKAWEKEQPPPAPPRMGLWIDEAGPDPKLIAGRVLLRDPNAKIDLAIDDFPLERVETVTWQVDGAAPVRFEPGNGHIWSAAVARPLTRGPHTVRVLLRTREEEPKEYAQEVLVRYQPPAPEVLPAAPPPAGPVNNPQYRVRATVKPADGVGVQVKLVQRHAGDAPREKDVGPDVDETVVLQPGDNEIEVIAENRDALAGFEDRERGRLRFTVRLTPPKEKVAPPQIVLDDGAVPGQGDPKDVEVGPPVVVHVPRVRLRGKVRAAEPLTALTLDTGAGAQPLAGFQAGKEKEFPLDVEVALDPAGPKTFRFAARAGDSDEARAEVTVDYRPRPPRVVELTAQPADLVEGRDPRQAVVTGRLEPPADRNKVPYNARVLVNGKPIDAAPVVDANAGTVEARVPLAGRDNSVAVELSNGRGEATSSEPVLVRYLSPPRNLKLEAPPPGRKAVVDVEGRVESALPLTTVEADVKAGKDGEERPLTRVEKEAAGDNTWKVRLRDVPLEPGENTVRLWASNADGRCLAPATVTVVYNPPPAPPPPPVVEITDPVNDTPVTTASARVRFRVRSAGPLQAVEVLRDLQPALALPLNLAGAQRDAQGFFTFEQDVPLVPGANPLVVRAVNAGGEKAAKVVVSRTEEPVRVVIDSLEPLGPRPEPIKPQRLPNGELRFPPVHAGMMRVTGHVAWEPREDTPGRGNAPPQVRVYVNGFQQAPVDLDPPEPGSRERTFRATVLFNRDGENHLEVEVPDLKQEGTRRREFAVTCTAPVNRQRLHLLIVGVGDQDPDQLREQVLKALGATPEGEDGFRKAGFAGGKVYATLTGSAATPSRVYTQLLLMKRDIDLHNKPQPGSDVVLVYYQGAEEIRPAAGQAAPPGGHFFLTSLSERGKDDPRRSIPVGTLREYLDDTLGAEVLLLDVLRITEKGAVSEPSKSSERGDLIANWTDDDHVGVFRYAWRGNLLRPGEAALLPNLEAAMAGAVTLEDLARLASQTSKYPSAYLDYYLPRYLGGFVVNRKP